MKHRATPDDLSPEEREAMKALQSEKMPDARLEERIVAALDERSLLNKNRGIQAGPRPESHRGFSARRWTAAAVLALGLLGIGFVAGRMSGAAGAGAAVPQFALLVMEDHVTPADEMALADEYAGWMRDIMRSGRWASGEKLHDHGRILRGANGEISVTELQAGASRPGRSIGGFFLIEAADYDEAVRIAATCPHLKYQGTIEVRQVHRL